MYWAKEYPAIEQPSGDELEGMYQDWLTRNPDTHHEGARKTDMRLSGEKQLPPRVPKIPKGVHLARIARMIDTGTHLSEYTDKQGNPKYQRNLYVYFEFPKYPVDFTDKDGNTKRAPGWVRMKANATFGSANRPSNLRDLYAAVMGLSSSDEWAGDLDPFDMLGRPCQVQIAHSKPDVKKNVWENIENVTGLPEETHVASLFNPEQSYEISLPGGGVNRKIPEWVGEKLTTEIMASREWRAEALAAPDQAPDQAPGQAPTREALERLKDFDDSVPF